MTPKAVLTNMYDAMKNLSYDSKKNLTTIAIVLMAVLIMVIVGLFI